MTICSYDNAGQIKFDVDVEMEQGYWNTSQSRLWTRIRDLFHDELVEIYKDMRNNGFDYNTLMSYFYDKQIALIPQSYYNKDSDVKYIPYASQWLGKAHGNGYEHLKRWLKNRIIFMDTLFDFESSYNNDILTIRANTTEEMTITIETYTPLYQHITWKNGDTVKLKVDGKNPTTFTGKVDALTDQEVLIYGGSNIKRITGISSMNPDQMLIGSATRLVELVVTDCPLLTDINSSKANLSAHTYLNKLDLSNCPNLGGTLRLNNSPLIQDINMKGTGITSVQLPSSIRNLTTLRLPSAITSLELNDARLLSTLELEEGHNLNNISLTNCNKLTNCINFDLTQVEIVRLDNSYDTEELYMSKTTNLTLNNMKNLKRLIYIPNEEIEEFNLSNLMSASEYVITTFNCPNLTDFITTSQQRLSYGLESDGNIYPNKVFMASLLNLSNTQFTNIKFLCTTDLYKLMLPTTVKNFYCDSAFDLDTTVVTDGDYDVIHGDLIEPYTTNYNEGVILEGAEKQIELSTDLFTIVGQLSTSNGSITTAQTTWSSTDFIKVNYKSKLIVDITTTNQTFKIVEYDENKQFSTGHNILDYGEVEFLENTRYIRLSTTALFRVSYIKYITQTPNIVSTSANGSLIYNVWSTLGTQPSSTSPYIWDLTGLKFNDFHTYGMNNWIKTDENGNITMPQRTTGYSVRLQNADITPNDYNTMLYPLFIDTTLPITGKLDYSKYKGNNLSWAFAYTTDDVVRTPLASNKMGNVKYDYNKLYNTDFVDITDAWIYKDTDCSLLSNNTNITKVQIELTNDNYKTRVDEVLQHYPNATEVYFFDNNDVTSLSEMFNANNGTYKNQIKNVYFMEGYFSKLTNLNLTFPAMTNLISVNNLPNTVTTLNYCFNNCSNLTRISNISAGLKILTYAFRNCKKLNQQFDFSNLNISSDKLINVFEGCTSLTYTPILPSNYTGSLASAFQSTKITVAPVLPNGVTNLSETFSGCTELTTVGNVPTSCTSYNSTFYNCSKLTSVPVNGWKGNMSSTFYGCTSLNQQVVISSATVLMRTFYGCTSLAITPTFPSNVNGTSVHMQECFKGCSSLVTPPTTPNGITSLQSAYHTCTNLTSAPNIPSSCTNIAYMLQNDTKISSVTIPLSISSYTASLNNCGSVSGKTPNITWEGIRTSDFSLTTLCSNRNYFKEDVKELVNNHLGTVSSATLTMNSTCLGYLTKEEKATAMMKGWNLGDTTFAHIRANTDVSTLTENTAIKNCVIELTSSNYKTRLDDALSVYPNYTNVYLYGDSSVTTLENICNNAQANAGNKNAKTKIRTVTFLKDGFENVISLQASFAMTYITTVTFNNLKVSYLSYAFQSCKSLTKVLASELNTTNLRHLEYGFTNCSKLTVLDVSNWDTSYLKYLQYAFSGCSALTTLDVRNWDTSSFGNMNVAFGSCTSLTTLDVSKWNLQNAVEMNGIFQNDSSLEVLDFSNVNLSKMANIINAFNGCTNLKVLDLGSAKTTVHDCRYTNASFNNCTSLTYLNLSKFRGSSITEISGTFKNCSALTDIVPFSTSGGGLKISHDLSYCTSLSASELVEWINSLATVTNSPTLTLGSTNLAKLTDEQKALATNKGWTLA